MLHKMIVFWLVAVSMIILAASDVQAGYYLNGRYYAKGVECLGESVVKNINKNMVSLACSVDPGTVGVILVCQNPGGNLSTGRAFIQGLLFNQGLATAQISPDKNGKVTFDSVVNAQGINPPQNANCAQGDAYCNCSYDTTCTALRGYCPNDNWLPIDVTPIDMTATVAEYFCNNDGYHTCPCDPNITPADVTIDPTLEVKRCATATGNGKAPWSYDWSLTGGNLVPAAIEVSDCSLPDPNTWQFGESRQYGCTVVLDQGQ